MHSSSSHARLPHTNEKKCIIYCSEETKIKRKVFIIIIKHRHARDILNFSKLLTSAGRQNFLIQCNKRSILSRKSQNKKKAAKNDVGFFILRPIWKEECECDMELRSQKKKDRKDDFVLQPTSFGQATVYSRASLSIAFCFHVYCSLHSPHPGHRLRQRADGRGSGWLGGLRKSGWVSGPGPPPTPQTLLPRPLPTPQVDLLYMENTNGKYVCARNRPRKLFRYEKCFSYSSTSL